MGPATTPRHRADVPRAQAFAELRRRAAQLVVGRDLYADDVLLRGDAGTSTETTEDDAAWAAFRPGVGTSRPAATA